MKKGYENAIKLAREKLLRLSPEKVCGLCGVSFEEDKYIIKWLSKNYGLPVFSNPDYSQSLEIIFLHYLISEGTKKPEGKLISYRDVPNAMFYEPKFVSRAVEPFVKCFGKNPEKFIEISKIFGGVKSSEGDFSIKINLLPYLPVTYILWEGDDEFEPAGNILFDKTAPGRLCAEDLAVAASLGTYELIGKYKNLYK